MSASAIGTTIQGVVDAGQNVAGFPVSMGFKDNAGKNQFVTGDAAGNLNVTIAAVVAAFTLAGTLTNNNAAPAANNLGVLPAVANAAAPTWTEGNQTLLSVTLGGALRGAVAGTTAAGSAVPNPVVAGMSGTGATVRYLSTGVVFPSAGDNVLAVGDSVWDGANFQKAPGTATGGAFVQGPAASGSALAGNPVLIAGSDGTNAVNLKTAPTISSSVSNVGMLYSQIGLWTSAGNVQALQNAASISDASNGANMAAVAGWSFNNNSWDRTRNNIDATLLASAARTTTQGPTNITTYNARAIYIVLDMTNVAAAPSVTLKVDMIDPASGKAINLLTGVAVVAVSTNIYKIGLGLTPAANAVVSEYLPRTIAITVTANNANSGTYSVGYSLIAA